MEDDDSDSDAEMADYGTDSADDVDPSFDAKGQGTSTTRIHCRNTLTPIVCRRIAGGPDFR